jgi:simple sugar transport system ATP-binding protein
MSDGPQLTSQRRSKPVESADPATAGIGVPAVELLGITKRFPGVLANDNVSLTVYHGEAHCLLGENGAGKSTLMSILSGMQSPDSGQIRIDGKEATIVSPRQALDLGIGMVYQHSALVPALTVLQNLMLGESHGLRLQVDLARQRLHELGSMLGIEIDPNAEVHKLALGQQQQVEIVKALWRGSRVLILDEPTSMLTPQGVADLQQVLMRLKSQGLAIVFITHKLHEALSIGDRVSILKGGRLIGSLSQEMLRSRSAGDLQALIVETMFGEEARAASEVAELQGEIEIEHKRRELASEVVLTLHGVSARAEGAGPGIHDVSLALRRGEILGIAGVDGNGQRELAEAIAGQRPITTGEIHLEKRSIGNLSVSARQRLGLRYVTDDRLGEGIVHSMSVAMNLVLKRIGQQPFWQRGIVQQRSVDRLARALVKAFDVRTPTVTARVGTLSGGNIQKVLLARELSFDPQVVVYSKPTQGLDVKTTRLVRQRIRDQAHDAGVSAIVISTDLEELLDLCDSIAVLYRGRLAGTVENGPEAGERIGELMIGGKAA